MVSKILSIICNLIISIVTVYICVSYFKGENGGLNKERGRRAFRFFTTLSNAFSAIVCLRLLAAEIAGAGQEKLDALVRIKYLSTVTVTVTLVTVILVLAPAYGFKPMFAKESFHMHFAGPVLAIVSFCFFERYVRIGPGLAAAGTALVMAYGAVYLYKVVVKGEDNGGWPDFYGFNRDGKWPASIAGMFVLTLAVSLLIFFLHNSFLD